jgi:Sterol methyltransferase C-terminal.
MLRILILLGCVPYELKTFMDLMWCCRAMTMGGRKELFTPSYLFHFRKPVEGDGAINEERSCGSGGLRCQSWI